MPKPIGNHQILSVRENKYTLLGMVPDKETALRTIKKALQGGCERVLYVPPAGGTRIFVLENNKVQEVKKKAK